MRNKIKIKNTLVKILVVSMAVSVFAFAGTGCEKKNDTSASNTPTNASVVSETSTENSTTETGKAAESKTEESKTAASEKSSEQPTENSTEKSLDETPTTADTMTEEMMLGTWEYNVGSSYMGLQLLDNGSAFINANEIDRTMIGTWVVEDNSKLKLTYWGESSYYVLKDGILYSVEHPSQFFTKNSNE